MLPTPVVLDKFDVYTRLYHGIPVNREGIKS
jgi:hypothetical protein